MTDTAKKTILIVDDTEGTRYTLSRILKKAGYDVDESGTGADTLRLAVEQPDLIILDVNLPDMSGHDVCRILKADPATSSIPVLHLSASFVDSENRAEGLEHGADGYLTYPIESRELVANVEALLRIRRAEREVRRQRELLRITLHSIGDAVIATDRDGRVTFLNEVAATLTGWTQKEALGQPLTLLFHIVDQATRAPIEDPFSRALQERREVGLANHTILIARDGRECAIDDNASPIRDEGGQIVGVILVFRDVTERQKLEAALRERANQLADADQRKDEFLAMLAHELRNPLAPIRNALHMERLADPHPNATVQEARDLMERQIEQMVRLVDDLLDMSRITRGKIHLYKEPCDIAAIIARAVEGSRPVIDERNHLLKIDLPAEQITVDADPVRLAQVFLNLLTNAAKYTAEGGRLRVIVEKIPPGPNTLGPAGEVVVRVQDSGVGISKEMLPKVFDLFTQVERSLDRAEGGLGIGLTLVNRLTEMHGGKVEAESDGLGQGSEFRVRLPLATATAPASNGTNLRTAQRAAPIPRRILVVDDNRDSAESLAVLLRLMGNDVRTVFDGRMALEIAKNYRPELVLLDIGLPGMNGLEVCERFRSEPVTAETVIMAMTGYGQEEDKRRSAAAGFDAHLIKPVDLDALLDTLARPELLRRPSSQKVVLDKAR